MLNVKNKKAVNRISMGSLKGSQTRNWIAIFAIMLTMVLFTMVFTVGASKVESFQRETMRQVGTSAHGGFKYMTWQQYEKLAKDPKIKDVSYSIMIGFGENPELLRTYTEIRYSEEKSAEWSFCQPTTGAMPKEYLDVATSTAVLDALSVPHELGAAVSLTFTANGKTYKETFTLCGFWEQDRVSMANEAYLSREYCNEVAPVWQDGEEDSFDWANYSGSIHSSVYFSSSWNLEKQMESLKSRCGFGDTVKEGVNWAYMADQADGATMSAVAGILLVIALSGYLIIYNIFYISVNSDIKFYGLLKTIGMTNRQLRAIVRRQALALGLAGIPLGLLMGYGLSIFVVPVIMDVTSIGKDYIGVSASPAIFAGSAFFTLATLWLSCIKPCRLISRISPLEAVRYAEAKAKVGKAKRTRKVSPFSMALENRKRMWKKTVAVGLSMFLSILLLHGTVTLVEGFDLNAYLEYRVVSDFCITDATITNIGSMANYYNSITDEIKELIGELDGITEMGSIYMSEHSHKMDGTDLENAKELLESSKEQLMRWEGMYEGAKEMLEANQEVPSHLYGLDGLAAEKISLEEGEMDWEKFKSGDYVVISPYHMADGNFYRVGDKVTVSYGDKGEKEYEVMAIGSVDYAITEQHSHIFQLDFIMDSEEFRRQTGETGAMRTIFNVEEEAMEKTERWIEDYCSVANPSLDFVSRGSMEKEFMAMVTMFYVVGGILSFVLALIGLLNFTNSMITSIQARKQEFAVLQSIGMTGRQLMEMLLAEGLIYVLATAILSLSLGNVAVYLLMKSIGSQLWFFSYHFTILPVALCILAFGIFAIVIPMACCRAFHKKSIVDRLREWE